MQLTGYRRIGLPGAITVRRGVPGGRYRQRGHLRFHLHGRTLWRGYALTRIREGEDETWLLTKRNDAVPHGDAGARPKLGLSQPESVLSGAKLDNSS
ncbi:hypothetical protein [Mycobacterium gastri]|uniref:Uncharacterized protein n=1 Tax=Mycobacterium gastri TaxID=1777 RepID=A0A1X1VY60_MYCGS|nr:hypothetical protein [Mycobacterium gastri]ETW23460.1 hypothetical protein MGAST_14090 [Mycobacterium gastri 'Wayne']ORV74792.1 hypothetical protein AWC07_24605 [Mycobacterium gastri]